MMMMTFHRLPEPRERSNKVSGQQLCCIIPRTESDQTSRNRAGISRCFSVAPAAGKNRCTPAGPGTENRARLGRPIRAGNGPNARRATGLGGINRWRFGEPSWGCLPRIGVFVDRICTGIFPQSVFVGKWHKVKTESRSDEGNGARGWSIRWLRSSDSH
jgi:hypothetical protein